MLKDVTRANNVRIVEPVNLYKCVLREGVFIGPFVEIQEDVIVGAHTRIQSHTFVCAGVVIEERCFIAHGVMFVNDPFDRPLHKWELRPTHVGHHTRIGANATILPVTIGEHAIIGAGAVVTRDVPRNAVVAGNPARILRYRSAAEVEEDVG